MTTTSKTKSHFKQVLLEIFARRLRENNQKKYIDCLKPRSNKNELECTKCGYNKSYASKIIEDFYSYYCPFCNV